ncbi:hypothetical protein IQ07DRAFT_509705 [Pyrenochaeta sp. DS3sAY3a]|nr:hypothetical protein IQ07DRAFT_509705 [Pyrenochaeta sp. DS3sAY3a]
MLLRFVLAALLSVASYALTISPNPAAPSVNSSKPLITDSDVYNETAAALGALSRFLHGPGFGPGLGPGPELAIDFDPSRWYADDELWERYVQKGEHLVCLMQATDRGAGFLIQDTRTPPSAASPWNGDLREELHKWFWKLNRFLDEGDECNWAKKGLKDVFDGLRLNAFPSKDNDGNPLRGKNDCVAINHYDMDAMVYDEYNNPIGVSINEQTYIVDGRQYRATGGSYNFDINKVDGAIIGLDITSPAQMVKDSQSGAELPALHRLSDIYWGYWFRENPNVRNLRVYGGHYIINQKTVLLTARAFRNTGFRQLVKWPGTRFSAETPEGKALLASPIGATIAHLLIQHKADLGLKHITEVIVVTRDPRHLNYWEKPELNLFFIIEDVPADKVTEDPPESEEQHGQDEEISENVWLDGEGTILYRKDGGKNILRVHTLTA